MRTGSSRSHRFLRKRLIPFVLVCLFTLGVTTSASAEDVETSYGGYSLVTGFFALGSVTPLASWVSNEVLSCGEEECPLGATEVTLVGLTWTGAIAAVGGIAWSSAALAEHWDWSPDVGWGIAGGLVGAPTVGLLYLALPAWEPSWAYTSLGLVAMTGGAYAGQHVFRSSARRRGHAYPEYGFGLAGVVTGAALGSWIGGDDYAFLSPLLAGIGGAIGVGLPALLSTQNDAGDTIETRGMSLSTPLMIGTF